MSSETRIVSKLNQNNAVPTRGFASGGPTRTCRAQSTDSLWL